MNENTKLVLVFIVGVIVGVLGATSTLFKEEPAPSPAPAVTSSTASDTGRGAEQSVAEAAPRPMTAQQAASEPESSEPEAEAPAPRSESSTAQADSATSSTESEPEAEEALEVASAEPGSDERIFCMQMENTGQCQCYDAETMAAADVSAEECRRHVAEQ